MKLSVDGVTYEFEAGKFMFQEVRAIQKATGLTMQEFFDGLDKGDVESLGALIWIMKKRNGDTIKYSELDFDLSSLVFDMEGEENKEGEADPTATAPVETVELPESVEIEMKLTDVEV